MENQTSAFINDEKVYNSPIKSQPKPERNIGIDTKEVLFDNIANAGISSQLDISSLESFSNVSQSRDQLYAMLDTMSQDSIVSAVLETYAEDATEYGDNGRIVWAESSDGEVSKYITFLLDTIGADKHIYKWVYSLCKYGDLYLKLFRESESKDLLFGNEEEKDNTLNEDVKIKAFSKNDRYTHYVEMVPNPAEIFELTKFGKTYGYIKAPTMTPAQTKDNLQNIYFKYKFNKADIDVYNATEFVHASLEDNSSRTPEEVNIFLDKDNDDTNHLSYTVRRGQSLLYNVFKIWRELNLLENSVLLNRITKSSIVRVINVEVGDMPKENVGPHLTGIKQLIEQKSALNEGNSLNEYTNPGPIENNVYVPTRGGQGALTTQQIGGDVDIKSLADLDYFKNKFFGALRVPKQYFGDTDDGAGFNGGQSLSIISSRYAKMVKRIQNTVLQALTDAINLMLLDKGLDSYVNRFELKMLPPTTQEEIDRRENLSSKIQIATDIMNTLGEIEDNIVKIKILKSLLSTIVNDSEVIALIEDYIEKLEKESITEESTDAVDEYDDSNDNLSMSGGPSMSDLGGGLQDDLLGDMSDETDEIGGEETTGDETSGEDETILPSPADLELDLTDNNTEI
jgi:hypothetical protein